MNTYEKKYKEALSWMQSLYDGLHGATKKDAEHYFPELKESEDEKIRKWLISQLKIKSDDTDSDLNIMIDKAIAWLEKQGEKKHSLGERENAYLDFTQSAIEFCYNENNPLRKELVTWLKSLKNRYTWKPSDEQMKAFENFVRDIWESCYDSPYENKAKLLYSLLEQLKKLK